ncbi:hypothetical protein D3C81_2341790 [compost metagenome]
MDGEYFFVNCFSDYTINEIRKLLTKEDAPDFEEFLKEMREESEAYQQRVRQVSA